MTSKLIPLKNTLLFFLIFLVAGLLCANGRTKTAKDSTWVVTSSGCKVYRAKPEKNETITWSGPCTNGYASGEGTLVRTQNGKPIEQYTGTLKKGIAHGKGKLEKYLTKEILEGQFINGELEGRGKYISFSQTNVINVYYEGEFRKSLINGYGKRFEFDDLTGDTTMTYFGNFVNTFFDGAGVYAQYGDQKIIYKGNFVNDHPMGQGEFWSYQGQRLEFYYSGNFEDEDFNGSGSKLVGHNRYEGNWKRSKMEGCGDLFYDTQLLYTGEWKNDKFHGVGKRFFPQGGYYYGEFSENERHGFGVMIWKDGTRYVGEFKKELLSGWGYTVDSKNFLQVSGYWENGMLLVPEKFRTVKEKLTELHRGKIQQFDIYQN